MDICDSGRQIANDHRYMLLPTCKPVLGEVFPCVVSKTSLAVSASRISILSLFF